MGLRAEFSLGNSEYNDFLFAVVGDEPSGQPLTVLSAMARLGLDPWEEAARLAGLGRTAATSTLAALFAGLPDGDRTEAESYSIAVRLVSLLPRYASRPAEPDHGVERPDRKLDIRYWLFRIALAAAAVLVLARFFGK